MAFISNQVIVGGQEEKKPKEVQQSTHDPNKLSKEDLSYLLNILKDVDLKGYQVEMFYSLVVKIQNQYLILQESSG
jgi:hypothetical protein